MLINSDVLDIADRLKEIDASYRLHYDTARSVFELRNTKGEVLLVYPYKTIDPRMVYKARQTRIERSAELMAEIEAENEAIRATAQKKLESDAMDAIREGADEYYYKKRRRQI